MNYLTSFDWISVREKSAEKLLRKLIDRPIHVTLDPTLLLSRDVWTRVSTLSASEASISWLMTLYGVQLYHE